MVVVKHKDPGDGSIKIANGKIVEKRVEGITLDDGENTFIIHRRNILEIKF